MGTSPDRESPQRFGSPHRVAILWTPAGRPADPSMSLSPLHSRRARRPLAPERSAGRAASAVVLVLAGAAFAWPAALQDGDPPSLEDLARAVGDDLQRQATLVQGPMLEVLQGLDGAEGAPGDTTIGEARRALGDLGPAAVPLMVPYVDATFPPVDGRPGEATPGRIARAEAVSGALREAASVASTDGLLTVATSGSGRGRVQALRALRSTPDAERVLPVLAGLVQAEIDLKDQGPPPIVEIDLPDDGPLDVDGEGADGGGATAPPPDEDEEGSASFGGGRGGGGGVRGTDVKQEALLTIAALGTRDADAFLLAQLTGDSSFLRASASEALATIPAARGGPMMLKLAQSEDGWSALEFLVAYYDQNDALLETLEHSEALLVLALDDRVPDVLRAELFDLMRVTDMRIPPSQKRKIDQRFLDDDVPATLRRSTLLLLARRGSRSAKRELTEALDDRVRDGRNLRFVLAQRAEVLHAIGDYNAAIRDWRDAVDQNSGSRANAAVILGLARSFARAGKFRDAEETLQASTLSPSQLRALARDRDFREMAASRYADVFRIDGDD